MMSSVAKKDKPTMSVTALINWAQPAAPAPAPMSAQPAPTQPMQPNLMQQFHTPIMPTDEYKLDHMQCKYSNYTSGCS